MNRIIVLSFILIITSFSVSAQERDLEDIQRMMAEIGQSHIDGNVPEQSNFHEFLLRDLRSYYDADKDMLELTYELLREQPTQVGISFPKYYVWVIVRSNGKIIHQEALLIAAIKKEYFEVFDSLSKQKIPQAPSSVSKIFPHLLTNKIHELAGVEWKIAFYVHGIRKTRPCITGHPVHQIQSGSSVQMTHFIAY